MEKDVKKELNDFCASMFFDSLEDGTLSKSLSESSEEDIDTFTARMQELFCKLDDYFIGYNYADIDFKKDGFAAMASMILSTWKELFSDDAPSEVSLQRMVIFGLVYYMLGMSYAFQPEDKAKDFMTIAIGGLERWSREEANEQN